MFLKLLGCWCIVFSFFGVKSQEVRDSFNSGYNSKFSNSWNSNNGFSISNSRPFTGNINKAESNVFSSRDRPNENKFSSSGSEKNYEWGHETAKNIDKAYDWNSRKPSKENDDRRSSAFNNRPNEKNLNTIISLPNSPKRNENSNGFTSNSNKGADSGFSSWGYHSAKPPYEQSNRIPESWNSNDQYKNKPNENSESDYEDNSVYSSWSSSNNKKNKPTPSSYKNSGNRESTTQKSNKNFENPKWEQNKNKKPQKIPESNMWEINNPSQPGREKTSSNYNSSLLDTSILDELDKNEWYFGKESNYPKPPFRSTLNINVSELWNFDKTKKSNQNSRRNGNGGKIINNNNSRRNRQIERFTESMGGIHCECVNVNLCEEEDMIVTQENVMFELRSLEEFRCKYPTEVCCTNPKTKMINRENSNEGKREQLQCGQTKAGDYQFESFEDNIAEPGEFPWSLRLEHAEINCSASLIHHKMALTAAHCVKSAQPDELTLKAGVWNSNNEPSQIRQVTKIIQHPDYSSRNPRNDIALLVVETPFELTDNVNTICLPVTNTKWDSNRCIIAGWRSEEILGQDSEIFEKDVVNFLPQTECQNIMLITDLWRNYILHDSFICGTVKSKRKSCTGDEGGFVICPSKKSPGTYLQIGIVSIGINCDNFGRPGIFTNVLKFLDWINQNYFELGLFDDIDIRNLRK